TADSSELDNDASNDSATQTLQVVNAPGTIQFSTANYEQHENAGSAVITLKRTGGTEGNVTVSFVTQGGTAQPNVNYTPVTTLATFPDGQSTTTVDIPLLGDGVVPPTLTVGLTISSPSGGASLGQLTTATLDIVNDDIDTVPPSVTGVTLLGPGTT